MCVNEAIKKNILEQRRNVLHQEVMSSDRRPFIRKLLPLVEALGGPINMFGEIELNQEKFEMCEEMLDSWSGWENTTQWTEFEEICFDSDDGRTITTTVCFLDGMLVLSHTIANQNKIIECKSDGGAKIIFGISNQHTCSVSLYSHVHQTKATIIKNREFKYKHWTYVLSMVWSGINTIEADRLHAHGHPTMSLKIICGKTPDPVPYCAYSLILKVIDDCVHKLFKYSTDIMIL